MKRITSLFIPIFWVALLLPLSSCMHAVMMGGHDGHTEQMATVTKEVVNGDNVLSVTISPMTVGKDGTVTLAYRSKASLPESVFVHYMILEDTASQSAGEHNHAGHSNAAGEFKAIHESALLTNGTAIIAYTPLVAGTFVIRAQIENPQNAASPFSLETTFIVREKDDHGMMGMGSMWDYPVIGVLAMGGMMLIMWAARGGL